ncbi:helix-turn-helix transcriptional regulator [Aquitalea magnusonii]|uniref:helix-turn-helix transcriptional regulator n=1 Tax=Aquitalea magnusonii TaxID=332411 RepID=UPI000B5D0007|nr:AlpA family phage regulatory protein [Aquitalea magnusonii]
MSQTTDLPRQKNEPKAFIQPIFIDLPSVAAALSISISTVQALVRAGDLPGPRKISGGRVGWLWREVVEWAESRPLSDIPPPQNTGAKKPRKSIPQDDMTIA